MGLDYSMVSYIPKENFFNAMNWLHDHTYDYKKPATIIKIQNQVFSTNAYDLYINGSKISADVELPEETVLKNLKFDLGLKLKLDSAILKFLEGGYGYTRVPENSDPYLLPNHEVWIGLFDSRVDLLEEDDLFRFEFAAVNSDMSLMLKDSFSMADWLLDFSKTSHAKLSFFNFEGEEKFIYHQGREEKISFKSLHEHNDKNIPTKLVSDFYRFESALYPDYNFNAEPIDDLHARINVIEEDFYNIYLLGKKWYLEIIGMPNAQAINFRELSVEEIHQAKRKGRDYTHPLANQYYSLLAEQHREELRNKAK